MVPLSGAPCLPLGFREAQAQPQWELVQEQVEVRQRGQLRGQVQVQV